MFFKKFKELILGVLMTAFTVFYYIMTTQVKQKPGVIGAATVPYVLCGILAILSVLQLIHGVRFMLSFDPEKAAAEKKSEADNVTLLKTIVLIVAYIAVMQSLGFILATIAYLFLQFWVLTPADQKPNFVLYIILAAAVAIIVYLGFRYGLQLKLPQGLIKVV